MKTGLLIIDVQDDYFPCGRMELDGAEEACKNIETVLARFREKRDPVVYIQHVSLNLHSTFFLPNTSGVEIHASIQPRSDEKVFVKNYPNSFRQTGLDEYLKEHEITDLVIAGMMTHMCIDTTVRAAFDIGYSSIVLGDCCATRSLCINGVAVDSRDVQNSFLAALNGTFSRVMDTGTYLQEKK